MPDFFDALQDARAELAAEGVNLSTREAVVMSLNATHGNGDMYPTLRDQNRHPFGWSPLTVPTDGHQAPAPLPGAMTPDGPRAVLPGARADGSTDLPDAA